MKKCKIETCNEKLHSHGCCNKHRIQIKRHGKITDVKIEPFIGEIWADIPDHENYKISNYGRVLNKTRNTLLKTNNGKNGTQVKLGEKSSIRIAVTIAKAFIPNTHNDTRIVFLDGDKENIQLGNIQWKAKFRSSEFMDNLKKDKSILGVALFDYCVNGSPEKLNSIICENYVDLRKTAFWQISKSQGYSFNFDNAMIDDALQEGLSALKRGMLLDISNFIGWLATIIRNTAKNIMAIERRFISENVKSANGDEFSLITTGIV